MDKDRAKDKLLKEKQKAVRNSKDIKYPKWPYQIALEPLLKQSPKGVLRNFAKSTGKHLC